MIVRPPHVWIVRQKSLHHNVGSLRLNLTTGGRELKARASFSQANRTPIFNVFVPLDEELILTAK